MSELNLNKRIKGAKKPYKTPGTSIQEAEKLFQPLSIARKQIISRIAELFDPGDVWEPWMKLDFKDAFHMLVLTEESIPVTAFYFNNVLFEYVRVPFGHVCAMNAFCCLMALLCWILPRSHLASWIQGAHQNHKTRLGLLPRYLSGKKPTLETE